MADHMIKMSEVPKGQRYQQFKDYYQKPLILTIIGAIIAISLIKTMFFAPKPDSFLLAAASYQISDEFLAATEEVYAENGLDVTENGKSLIQVTPLLYNPVIQKTDPQAGMALQTRLFAVLTTAENIMQIVDEDLFVFFKEQGLIGKYSDLGDKASAFDASLDSEIKIPLSEMAFFKDERFSGQTDGLYMTIRPRDASQLDGKKKKIANYEKQIDAFVSLCK